MDGSKFSHVDLVVSSIETSLAFYRGLLEPVGWTGLREMTGERGESIWYLSRPGLGAAALGLRERPPSARRDPHDRYAVGLHHICFDVPSRAAVDERARWLADRGAVIETPPSAYDYTPGYYAVYFYDPDGIKLELLHRPLDDLANAGRGAEPARDRAGRGRSRNEGRPGRRA